MAIHPSGLFECVGAFTEDSFRDDEVVVQTTEQIDGPRLLGPSPRARFWSDRLVLMTTDRKGAILKYIRYWVGDAIERVAAPGDVLHLVRTMSGQLGLSVRRGDDLIFALGAVSSVNLGSAWTVRSEPSDPVFTIALADASRRLRCRESIELLGYDVYLERPAVGGTPGADECLSVVRATTSSVVNAARRGAVLLETESADSIGGERLDGSLIETSRTR